MAGQALPHHEYKQRLQDRRHELGNIHDKRHCSKAALLPMPKKSGRPRPGQRGRIILGGMGGRGLASYLCAQKNHGCTLRSPPQTRGPHPHVLAAEPGQSRRRPRRRHCAEWTWNPSTQCCHCRNFPCFLHQQNSLSRSRKLLENTRPGLNCFSKPLKYLDCSQVTVPVA